MQKQEQKTSQTNPFSEMEEEVLDFWKKNKIFEKSVERKAPKGDYVFYDGPPFGTGEPHYGHILSSVSKDVVPRYWTMKGFRVERKWGWDCHGLPIENIIEQDMKISGKKQIEEEVGEAKFNEACRARVLEYADIWGEMVKRIGRWVDFKSSYKTMDLSYMESVWWAFKTLWNKKLVYEGRKVLLYCPRCETPISNFEVAMDNSYKDVMDTSVYVKFHLRARQKWGNNKYETKDTAYILVWTTTPWTLPGNVALAVGKNITYTALRVKGIKELLILASDRIEEVLKNKEIEIVNDDIKGSELVGLEYEPLFDISAIKNSGKKAYYVVAGDFVTTEDGTGIVHIAPVYGEDDYKVGIKYDLPIVPGLDTKGHFNETVPNFKGKYFKAANNMIIEELESCDPKFLFAKEQITHSYPHCHRCDTALFYNAIPAWFLDIDKIRKKMLELNKNINWYPKHLKQGRFALGIEQAPDWNISRNRYFATPMPVWKCDKCEEIEIIGSVDELKSKAKKNNIKDIHSHFVNDVAWPCSKCGGEMRRIKEVFDCWVESGSMPFAQMHYPFENKEKFEKNFPAQFISEYISQTRAWFYVMHAISTALFGKNSFENVVTTGVILNEKGEKMSKSKKNFPDPWKVIDQYGADALRFYLMSSPVMHAENLFFSEDGVKEAFRKNIMILWNVVKFYELFAVGTQNLAFLPNESKNVLDKWILARLNQLIGEATDNMNNYNLPKAARPIEDFVNNLSTWYLRRSRDRFKGDDEADKKAALETTRFVLLELAKVMAPFMPFMAENLWQKVSGNDFKNTDGSVHLNSWPKAQITDKKILEEMEVVRKIVELGLAERDKIGVKVRQPLNALRVMGYALRDEYVGLIKDELNVKNIKAVKGEGELSVELDTEITPELKLEGIKRELVRFINNLRKDAGMTIKDRAVVYYEIAETSHGAPLIKEVFEKLGDEILKDTLSEKIIDNVKEAELKKEVKIDGEGVVLGIKKV